jgi:excisionase family DNA binding protein
MHTDVTASSDTARHALAERLISRPLQVPHVAKRLGLSRRTVRYLAKTHKLRAFKVGKKIWHFLPKDVEDFQARRENLHV